MNFEDLALSSYPMFKGTKRLLKSATVMDDRKTPCLFVISPLLTSVGKHLSPEKPLVLLKLSQRTPAASLEPTSPEPSKNTLKRLTFSQKQLAK